MPSEMAMAVKKGDKMAIIHRQTTMVFVLCRNKFSVAKRSKLMCLFNYLTFETILRNVSSPQRTPREVIVGANGRSPISAVVSGVVTKIM